MTPDGFLDGVSVAKSLGQDLTGLQDVQDRIEAAESITFASYPAKELDLKKAAKHFGEKKVAEMLPSKELTRVTGYVKGGCSPVGMKKLLPTAIDVSAAGGETIIVSGGKVGLQMELDPKQLEAGHGAEFVDLTVER